MEGGYAARRDTHTHTLWSGLGHGPFVSLYDSNNMTFVHK